MILDQRKSARKHTFVQNCLNDFYAPAINSVRSAFRSKRSELINNGLWENSRNVASNTPDQDNFRIRIRLRINTSSHAARVGAAYIFHRRFSSFSFFSFFPSSFTERLRFTAYRYFPTRFSDTCFPLSCDASRADELTRVKRFLKRNLFELRINSSSSRVKRTTCSD